jgi:CrcB protein
MASGSLNPLAAVALVGIGGAVGCATRYGAGLAIASYAGAAPRIAWATLVVNVVGCAAAGALVGAWAHSPATITPAAIVPAHASIPEPVRLLVLVGLLGGVTTFSAFGVETVDLLRRQDVGAAAMSSALNVVGSLGACWLGLTIARALTTP